jgi:hypothetical protein
VTIWAIESQSMPTLPLEKLPFFNTHQGLPIWKTDVCFWG